MKKDNGIWNEIAKGINKGGFGARLFGYLMFYIPVFFIFMTILYTSEILVMKNPGLFIQIIGFCLIFFIPSVPFILWERSIRKFRRKHGLSIYKNVREELEQMEINERVAKEHKAFVSNGLVNEGVVNKDDIGYWFGLFEKGAITKEEYEAKKKELI